MSAEEPIEVIEELSAADQNQVINEVSASVKGGADNAGVQNMEEEVS